MEGKSEGGEPTVVEKEGGRMNRLWSGGMHNVTYVKLVVMDVM